jgi:SAM-dependent methyltransferase
MAGSRFRRFAARAHVRTLHRLQPVDRGFGRGGGTPVDRYYGERFLAASADFIHGDVLEIGDDRYTHAFGRDVRSSSVATAPEADLVTGRGLPDGAAYDCVILYDTLQHIYDVAGAVATTHRLLRPGGALLATFNGIAQISRNDYEAWGEFWRPTDLAVRRLLDAFDEVDVQVHGNVLAACALLYGMSAEEIGPRRLETDDPDYQVCITATAQRTS